LLLDDPFRYADEERRQSLHFDAGRHRGREAGDLLHDRGARRPAGHAPAAGPCKRGRRRVSLSAIRLRPGLAAEKWLVERLQALKGGEALTPVTVLVPSNYAGLALRRR